MEFKNEETIGAFRGMIIFHEGIVERLFYLMNISYQREAPVARSNSMGKPEPQIVRASNR